MSATHYAHRITRFSLCTAVALILVAVGAFAVFRGAQDAHRDALANCQEAEQTMQSEVLGRDNLVKDHPELEDLSTSQVQDATTVTDLQSLITRFRQPTNDLSCASTATTASLNSTAQRMNSTAKQARQQAEDFRTAYERLLASQSAKSCDNAKDALTATKSHGEQVYDQYRDFAPAEYLEALRTALDSADDSDAAHIANSINAISTAINDVVYR